MTSLTLRALTMTIAAAAALSACSGKNKDALVYEERPADTLYNEAFSKLETKRYSEAAQLFDEVERQHPYSEWARRAMIMAAFTAYQNNDYDTAITTAERYITLYPGGETTAYAYYLVGLSYYEQIVDVGRDQRTTELALAALSQVERRYPESDYARDSRLKIDMTQDHLAGKEMEVGRYYLTQEQHLAAINRFRNVVDKYETTTHTAEALHRLVEAYIALGVTNEAAQVAAVLGYNYPNSPWYERSYNLLARQGVILDETGKVKADDPKKKGLLGRVF